MDEFTISKKRTIKLSIFIAIIIILISLVLLLIIKYNVEGEKNMPFELTSVRVVSSAQGYNLDDSINDWNLNIIQKNDFYFYLEKNKNYEKEESISKVIFNNFRFKKKSDIGNINIYKPSTNTIIFDYNEDYRINKELTFNGSLSTNLAALEISNQGGLMGFSIVLEKLGTYTSDNNDTIVHDGTILSKLNLTSEEIAFNVSFDIVIETASNTKYKTTLNFDLPVGNIIEEGTSIYNKEDYSDIIFKRI